MINMMRKIPCFSATGPVVKLVQCPGSRWFEILQKFRRYEKSEGTFRGSILAKKYNYKIHVDLGVNQNPYLASYWSHTDENSDI